MMSARTILDAIRPLIGEKPRIVVLHSSLYPFRLSEAEFKWPLLRAIDRLIAEGHTIAVPTFTFDFCKTGRFDIHRSRPETGQLGRMVMDLAAFKRSAHPIYSFAVAGPRADEILACKSSTTFSPDSPFGLFDRENAKLVMFGCGWEFCTQFHHYEEEAGVPYRLYKTFEPAVGEKAASAKMFVRNLDIGARNDFSAALRALDGKKAISRVVAGRGDDRSCRLRRFCASLPHVAQVRSLRIRRGGARDAAAGSEPAAPREKSAACASPCWALPMSTRWSDRCVRNSRHWCRIGTLNSTARATARLIAEAMTPGSALDRFAPDFIFFVDRLEDIYQVASLPAAETLDRGKLDLYVDAVAAGAARLEGDM